MAPLPVAPALRVYDHVLLDLDGCVWVGDRPTPRAPEAITALREAGKGIAFVTNDGRHGDDEFVRKLWRLGFQASREEVVTVGGAIQHVLAESEHRTAYVIGAPARAPPRDRRRAADPQRLGPRQPRRRRRRGRATTASTTTSCGAPCRPSRAAPRAVRRARRHASRCPTARGRGPGRSWRRSRRPRGRARAASASPSPQLFLTALDRLGDGPRARRRRPPRRRRRGRPRGRPGLRDRAHRPHLGAGRRGRRSRARDGRRLARRPRPRRLTACRAPVSPRRRAARQPRGGGRARARAACRGVAGAPARPRRHRPGPHDAQPRARRRPRARGRGRRPRERCASAATGSPGASRAPCAARPARVLGVLPGGRGNDFARALGLPLRPARRLRRHRPRAPAPDRPRRGAARAPS